MQTKRRRVHINPQSDLGEALRHAAEVGETFVVDAGEAIYEISAERLSAEEDFARSVANGQSDAIFDIVGIVASNEPTSIAKHVDEYLADTYEFNR